MTKHPRNRIIVFRLTQEEYRALKEACERHGARNVSDFTRTEVLTFLNTAQRADALSARFSNLEGEVAGLKFVIQHLKNLLEGVTHVQSAIQD